MVRGKLKQCHHDVLHADLTREQHFKDEHGTLWRCDTDSLGRFKWFAYVNGTWSEDSQ